MWTAIAAGIGLITTLVAYFINPERRKTEELNKIFKELDDLYVVRDIALEKNDQDSLTIAMSKILKLKSRKTALMS